MPLDALLLHPTTKRRVLAILAMGQPPHSLLLIGAPGRGKPAVAEAVARHLLNLKANQSARAHAAIWWAADGAAITIEQIRELHDFTKLKTTGERAIRRIIILPDAERMTLEAQNAFLKLLEEPPADTMIILTAPQVLSLLPTIVSRTQSLAVHAVEPNEIEAYYQELGYTPAAIRRACLLSEGRMGLIDALLKADSSHPLVRQIDQAKAILSTSTYERLAMVDSLAKQKEELPLLLVALRVVAKAALYQASQKGKAADTRRWHHILSAISEAEAKLVRRAQAKLLLAWLMLEL
jgi:DNA polymerase-3 subunit delta'